MLKIFGRGGWLPFLGFPRSGAPCWAPWRSRRAISPVWGGTCFLRRANFLDLLSHVDVWWAPGSTAASPSAGVLGGDQVRLTIFI